MGKHLQVQLFITNTQECNLAMLFYLLKKSFYHLKRKKAWLIATLPLKGTMYLKSLIKQV